MDKKIFNSFLVIIFLLGVYVVLAGSVFAGDLAPLRADDEVISVEVPVITDSKSTRPDIPKAIRALRKRDKPTYDNPSNKPMSDYCIVHMLVGKNNVDKIRNEIGKYNTDWVEEITPDIEDGARDRYEKYDDAVNELNELKTKSTIMLRLRFYLYLAIKYLEHVGKVFAAYAGNVMSALEMDDNVTDEQGLTWTNTGVTFSAVEKKYGTHSAVFDNAADIITSNAVIAGITTEEHYARFNSINDDSQLYMWCLGAVFPGNWRFMADTGGIQLYGDGAYRSSKIMLNSTTWYGIQTMWDNTDVYVYVDTVEESSSAANVPGTDKWNWGNIAGGGYATDGNMDRCLLRDDEGDGSETGPLGPVLEFFDVFEYYNAMEYSSVFDFYNTMEYY